jgi:curli production assembly/transport component CsgF
MKKTTIILVVYAIFSGYAFCSELVYKPINPSFGGNPLNGSFLLGKAQGQNKHKAPQSRKSFEEKVSDALERATLSDIVSKYKDTVLGESAVIHNGEDSTFISGDYQINILSSNSDTITIEVTDLLTDKVTIIEIPKFG